MIMLSSMKLRLLFGLALLVYIGPSLADNKPVTRFAFKHQDSDSACLAAIGTGLESLLNGMVDHGYTFFHPRWEISEGSADINWLPSLLEDIRKKLADGQCPGLPGENSSEVAAGNVLSQSVKEILDDKAFISKANPKGIENQYTVTIDLLAPLVKLAYLNFTPAQPTKTEPVPPQTRTTPSSRSRPNHDIPSNSSSAYFSALILLGLIGMLWRLIRLEKKIDTQQYQIRSLTQQTVSLNNQIESLITGLSGQLAELVSKQFIPAMKQELQNTLSNPELFQLSTSGQQNSMPSAPQIDTAKSERKDLIPTWINILNRHRGRGGVESGQWRLLGLRLDNFEKRQLIPEIPPEFSLLGETVDALRKADFWLVGQRDEPFELLVLSQSLLADRSVWLQSGSAMINAYIKGLYEWEVGNVFAAQELTLIKFDEDAGAVTVIKPGRLTFDLV